MCLIINSEYKKAVIKLLLRGDDVGEQRSKETDGGGGQSHSRRKRSGSFIAPLTYAEGVVIQRASSDAAAMKLQHTIIVTLM